MQWSKIAPRRIRRWWRDWKTSRDHEQANRLRRQVIEQLIADRGLTQLRRHDIHHVLFLVVDCLRRDHVSCYGYTRKTTPFLDSLAEQGYLLQDALSSSCWTYPSVSSILSGLYPHNHGGVYVEDPRDFGTGMMPQSVREDVLLLPEILSKFGFSTYFSTPMTMADLALKGRFQQVAVCSRKHAGYVLRHYVRWLRSHKEVRTFAYLQLGDLHQRIRVKDPYRSVFGKIPDIPRLGRWDYHHESTIPGDPGFERYRENRTKLYDAALFYVDAQLKECFRHLEGLKFMNKMLVVITADHGEELWDHMQVEKEHFFHPRSQYGVSHGCHLWQEVVGVPLLLWGNGIPTLEVYQRVTLVDLMPTVLQCCGIEGWEALKLDGQNLLDTIDERVILAEDVAFGYEKKAVFEGQYKLYYSKGDGVRWIFDLEHDPYEKTPLDLPDVADRLIEFLPKVEGKGEEKKLTVDEETRRRLRDLGYIE